LNLKTFPIALKICLAVFASAAGAHPHVFVDGGVDFVFSEETMLSALKVTWLYDEFETLYILSSHGMSMNANGTLDEVDRQELIRQRSDWPADFDGSAHLSIDGSSIALEWPKDLDAKLVDGRLQLTFTRDLTSPIDLDHGAAEVAFYESTYFFSFSVTQPPKILDAEACTAKITPFKPDPQNTALQATLAKLSREETSDIAQVGALFADRIEVTCA